MRSKDETLQRDYAKEVKYVEQNGSTGMTFQRGKKKNRHSMNSYSFGSPAATRT